MTPLQTKLYWREWGKARQTLIEAGLTSAQAAERRHAIHAKALGSDKSSTRFTNSDLDAVLGAFRAISDDANLDAQLHAIDGPAERREQILEDCHAALWDRYQLGENGFANKAKCEAYIAATARAVCKAEPADCTDHQLAIVRGCIRRSLMVARKKNPAGAAHMDKRRAERMAENPY